MILIEELAAVADTAPEQRDYLELEWYETDKTIIRRRTRDGTEIAVRRKNKVPLEEGDIIWQEGVRCIQVLIRPCACIVLKPASIRDMGIICFEIGNKHIPIYINEDGTVSIAYDHPLFESLSKAGYLPLIEYRKLLSSNRLKATVHGYSKST